MMKNCFVKGIVVLSLGLCVAGCSREDNYTQKDANQNAEKVFGMSINPGQNWDMTSRVTANVSVNLGLDLKYTVAVYAENPLFNTEAAYYAEEEIMEGGTLSFELSIPASVTTLYVAVYDSKFRSMVESVPVKDNQITVNFGGGSANQAARRAREADYAGSYAKSADDYLDGLSEDDMKEYATFTDADLYDNHNTLSNKYYDAAHPSGGYIGDGDGAHYRVAANESVTKMFHINGFDASWQYVVDGAVIYVEGSLTLGTNYTLNGVTIVVARGGSLTLDGTVNMSTKGRFIILPGGSVSGSRNSTWTVANGAPCYNAGSISFSGTLNTNGSDFYNNGTINVTTLNNQSGGKITNFGSITAVNNNGASDAYNCEFINGCYWHYTGNAGIGQLTMLENSRLEVDGRAEFTQNHTSQDEPLTGATPNTLMSNSVVKVGDLYATNTIFEGPSTSGEVAIVVITGKLMVGRALDITQWENCYFDWNHEEVYDKEGHKKTLADEDGVHGIYSGVNARITKYITEASSPVSIPAGDCTGSGYNPGGGGGGGGVSGQPAVWSYAFEDSWMADYDMNDVVLKVSVSGGKLKVTLCCTGATYPLYVYYGRNKLFGGKEVHKVLGGEGKFINTGDTSNDKFVKCKAYTTTINKPVNFNPATLDLWVESPERDIHLSSQGEEPHAVLIPADWKWPEEWTCIKDAYPDFVDFAADASHETNAEWYNNPVKSLLY